MKIVEREAGLIKFFVLCGLLIVSLLGLATWACASGTPKVVSGHQADDAEFLLSAVEAGKVKVVQLLVHDGADVNVCVRGDGTPLMVASQRGDLAMVKALASLGADVNALCRGDGNPLIVASHYGKLEVIKWLLAHGANVNAAVPDDETALITAARDGRLPVVKYLVTHGANVSLGVMMPSGEWRTPLNQAHSSSIRDFLLSHDAKNPPPTPPSSLREQRGGLNARTHA